jgi:Na+/H+-dicarboxylate symporter
MKWLKSLYVQVLLGITLGVLLGIVKPDLGASLEPLGTAFVSAVKMLIAPIIFCTVVHGIAGMGDLKKLGSVGWKALLYFEVVTTLALIIGLVVAKVIEPGTGMNVNVAELRVSDADSAKLAVIRPPRRSRAWWIICCTSFQRPLSVLSRKVRSCRCSFSPSWPASLSRRWAKRRR